MGYTREKRGNLVSKSRGNLNCNYMVYTLVGSITEAQVAKREPSNKKVKNRKEGEVKVKKIK
jgi:hypothetical protein